jgi:predicted ATP-grasp superfamily ATP-dependent carboligase
MSSDRLRLQPVPRFADGRMVIGFSGWMDGGTVSTGTIDWFVRNLNATPVGTIAPEGFYIYNLPGSMEVAAMFRPYTHIQDGIIRTYQPPVNLFYLCPTQQLLLFSGKEPNFGWNEFADCLFESAARTGVTTIYFVGSFGGTVPHTREPRLFSTVSDEKLKEILQPLGLRFTNYEGPASFSTYLLAEAPRRGILMASLVAEIPAYIQGTNPRCIEAVVRKLVALLQLEVDIGPLRALSTSWEEKLNEILESKSELLGHIRKLEEDYDNEVFDTQMADLKQWLEQQGIRVD